MRLVRILIGQRLIAACAAITLSSLSLADTEMGEDLYLNTEFSRVMNGEPRDDVTCSDCHDPGFYTRADRKANNYERLHFWVNSCNDMLGAGWFPDEVKAVTDYLNREYYQYLE